MAVHYDKPLLTLKQVKEMQADRDRVDEQVAALLVRKAALDKKLAAAALFMEDTEPGGSLTILGSRPNGTDELEPMTDAVVRIVCDSNKLLTMKELRKRLAAEGYPKSRLGNYFYTVMRRLVEKKRIARDGDVFGAPPNDPFKATRLLIEMTGAPKKNG